MATEQTNQTTSGAQNDGTSAGRSYSLNRWLDEGPHEGPWHAIELSNEGPVFRTGTDIDGNPNTQVKAPGANVQAPPQTGSTQQR